MTTPTDPSYFARPYERIPVPQKGPTYTESVYRAGCELRGVSYGKCWCGCNRDTTIAQDTDRSNWKLTGVPRQFIRGHAHALTMNPEYAERDCGYLTPCWIWMRGRGSINEYGLQYGVARRPGEGIPTSSHRYVYEKIIGADSIPDGYDLDHLCRITLCCNPDHIEPVTHEENVRRGTNTRLTPEGVRRMFQLRAQGVTFRAITEEFEISMSHAMKIIYGKKWKGIGSRVEQRVLKGTFVAH